MPAGGCSAVVVAAVADQGYLLPRKWRHLCVEGKGRKGEKERERESKEKKGAEEKRREKRERKRRKEEKRGGE